MSKHVGVESRQNARGETSYRGSAYDPRRGRTIAGPWMPSLSAARAWRTDRMREWRGAAGHSPTVEQAAAAWVASALDGRALNRSGEPYKPSAVHSYRQVLDSRLLPELGRLRLDELNRPMLQLYVNRLLAEGLSPSTVRNVLMPLRVILRDALAVGDVDTNPTLQLRLPASKGRRDLVVDADTAKLLLQALAPADAALWAFALFAGLRRGELMALRGVDVDLDRQTLRVERSFCTRSKTFVLPKSHAGLRAVPIASALRPYAETAAAAGAGLAFGRDATRPFSSSGVTGRAQRVWKDAGLPTLTLHNARHTFASYLIAAMTARNELNPKIVQTLMGHSSITVTFDRYGHLFPGSESAAREALDVYLA